VKHFIIWFFTSFFLGLLPLIVNLLAQFVLANVSFWSVLKVSELMCFVIVLSSTTLCDLVLQRKSQFNTVQLITLIVLIIQLLFSSILLGVNAYYSMSTSVHYDKIYFRIAALCTAMAIESAILCVIFQLILCRKQNKLYGEIETTTSSLIVQDKEVYSHIDT